MGRRQDKIEQALFTELAHLRQRMQEIHEEGGCQDPDRVMAELETEARLINEMLEEVLADLEAGSPRQTRSNLNELADEASSLLLTSVSFPVVVRTSLDPGLPEVLLSPELLRPIIRRALQISAEHQGPGCELMVKTSTSKKGNKARLDITATNRASAPPSRLPIKVRSASLAELVEEAGGEVELEEEQDRARLTLRLAHAVPAT